jgi:environmental stress-induced protein Ves
MKVIRSQEMARSNWSGGTSTELFIYPPSSQYAQRDFLFRLSTATVEVMESDFTHLPGVSRALMILEGQIEIIHENQYTRLLKKFDTEEFPGEWITKSKGICTDFNLISRGNTVGELRSAHLTKNQIQAIQIPKEVEFFFCYLNSGTVHFEYDTKALQAGKGDLLVIQNQAASNLVLKCPEDAELVFVHIRI